MENSNKQQLNWEDELFGGTADDQTSDKRNYPLAVRPSSQPTKYQTEPTQVYPREVSLPTLPRSPIQPYHEPSPVEIQPRRNDALPQRLVNNVPPTGNSGINIVAGGDVYLNVDSSKKDNSTVNRAVEYLLASPGSDDQPYKDWQGYKGLINGVLAIAGIGFALILLWSVVQDYSRPAPARVQVERVR